MIDRKLTTFILLLFAGYTTLFAQIPQEGLVAEYTFDNGDGMDNSGNQYHGEVIGAEFVNDRFDYPNAAVQFDGKGQYLELPVLPINGTFTISFWMETTDEVPENWPLGTFLVDRDLCYEGNDWSVGYGDDGLIQFNTGQPDETLLSNSKVNKGKWVHVAVQRDSAAWKKRIFINGKLDIEATTRQYVFNNTSISTRVGGSACDDDDRMYFKGKIDDLLIYTTDLEEDQIKMIYKQRKEKYEEPVLADAGEDERGEFLILDGDEGEEEAEIEEVAEEEMLPEATEEEAEEAEEESVAAIERDKVFGDDESSEEVILVEEEEPVAEPHGEEMVTEMAEEAIASNSEADTPKEDKKGRRGRKGDKNKEEPTPTTELPEPDVTAKAVYSPNIEMSLKGYPSKIDGKEVTQSESMVFTGKTITVKIWDDRTSDGDVVSLFVNDVCVLDNIELTDKPEKVKIPLQGKGSFLLVMVANELGTTPPATARVLIEGDRKESDILMNSTDKSCDAVEILQGF